MLQEMPCSLMKTLKMVPLAAAATLLTILSAASCNREPEKAGSQVQVVVALPKWFYPSEESPWLLKTWEAARRETLGVDLVAELVPGKTEHILQKLLVMRASGQGPDMACLRLNWMPQLLARGILKPMDESVPESLWAGLLPSLREAVAQEGKRYLLPYDIGVRVILYRSDLVEEAGLPAPPLHWSFETLVTYAKSLTVDRDGDGSIDQWGLGVPAARNEKSYYQWLPWFWTLGGNGLQEGGRAALATPAAIRAMQWYWDLAHLHRVTPTTLYSMDQEAIFQGLANGLFAMSVGGSWEVSMLKKFSPYGDKIRIALFPASEEGKASVTLVDGWGFGLLTGEPNKGRAVSRLLSGLCSAEHQVEKYRASGVLSPLESVYESPIFQEDPTGRILFEALRTGRAPDEATLSPTIVEAVGAAMQEVLMGYAVPEQALSEQEKRLLESAKEG